MISFKEYLDEATYFVKNSFDEDTIKQIIKNYVPTYETFRSVIYDVNNALLAKKDASRFLENHIKTICDKDYGVRETVISLDLLEISASQGINGIEFYMQSLLKQGLFFNNYRTKSSATQIKYYFDEERTSYFKTDDLGKTVKKGVTFDYELAMIIDIKANYLKIIETFSDIRLSKNNSKY